MLATHVFDQYGYLAGMDAARAADFTEMFERCDIGAVMCARGGYGASRMVDCIDWDTVCAHPKPFVGYSDITTLHLAMDRHAGIVTFHGPMVTTLGSDADDQCRRMLIRTLTEPTPLGYVVAPEDRATCLVSGQVRGRLAGGCLSLLCAALATPEEPDFGGCIVLLEDTHEPLYRVDRMLTQIVRSGCLDEAAGFVIGTVSNLVDDVAPCPFDLHELWADVLGPLGRPMLADVPIGHVPSPLTIPLGCTAELDAGAGTLCVLDPAVA